MGQIRSDGKGTSALSAFAEVGQVAIGVAGWSDAFIDLEDADGMPGYIIRCQGSEHLPWGVATADGDVE